MKAILISIRPQWVAKILNREKTIEIRKRFPKDYVGWVYIYCTKDRKYANLINRGGFLTGMVVAKFTLDNLEKWEIHPEKEPDEEDEEILKLSCLSVSETTKYAAVKPIYGWYINNLVVFDKPKEISEFKHICPNVLCDSCKYGDKEIDRALPICKRQLIHAPQSWCYIEI